MKQNKRQELCDKIKSLLTYHTNLTENGEYTSPDAYQMDKLMRMCSDTTIADKELFVPNSEFSSGGYKKTGSDLHEEILQNSHDLIHHYCYNCSNKISISYTFCPFCSFRQE